MLYLYIYIYIYIYICLRCFKFELATDGHIWTGRAPRTNFYSDLLRQTDRAITASRYNGVEKQPGHLRRMVLSGLRGAFELGLKALERLEFIGRSRTKVPAI